MNAQLRILHVDDDPDFAAVTADFLEGENDRFEVVTEMDATAVLDRLTDEQFDCVVSDYQMPRTNGLELLDAVREEFPDLPFVLFTNHGSEQVAAAAIEKGVTSYLQKETGGTAQYAMLANRIRTHVQKYRAERRARRLEREYELVARVASDVFWTFDHATRTAWFSDGIRHFGYDPGRIEHPVDADWLFERIHPDDRERVRDCQGLFPAGAEPLDDEFEPGGAATELRFRRADGSYADCQARGVVVLDDGEPSKVVGTLRDVTERKRRQRELEETTQRLQAVIEASPDAINMVDEDGNVEVWNPAAEELFGWTEEEVVGGPLPIVPGDREAEFARFRGDLFDGDPRPVAGYETQRECKDGTLVDVSVSTAAVRDTDGEVIGTMAVIEDITERKERQRRLDALSEAFPDIAFLIDEEGRHIELLASPASEDLLYADPDEMLGQRLHDFLPPEQADDLLSLIQTTLETGRQQTLEYELDVPAGARRLEARTTPLPTEVDDRRAVVLVARDVTERAERERELERQNDRLEKFVSIVSHDLRNPLDVADGRLTLAQEDCESDHLAEIERAHDRMKTLIEDLLTLAHEGETPTEVTPVSLPELAEASWQNVETGTATLAVETDRTVRADRGRLAQLFENLFRNSVEHGATDVTVTVGDFDNGFSVADDGPGFGPDERDRAFDSGYSTTQDGTGFGLSIVREIVDAHDWDVRITDGPDGGAQFEVTGVEFTTAEA